MNKDNNQIIKDIVGALRRMVRAIYLDSSQMSKKFGLTAPQSGVLRILMSKGPLSSAELSRKLYVTPSNITGIIDRLELKGLVERIKKQGDRRVSLVTLTQAGEALSQSIPDPIENKFIEGLADLSPEHVKMLAESLEQILKLVDSKELSDTPIDIDKDF